MRRSSASPVSLAAVMFALFAAVALAPQAVRAQSWSPQEQEAIDHLRACWSTWATEDYDTWRRICNLDPSGSYWNTEEHAPNAMDPADPYLRDIVLHSFADNDVVAWDIRPLRVTSWGDVVAVYFSTVLHLRDADGVTSVIHDRRLEIVHKVNGSWSVGGGMAVLGPGGG